MTTIADKYTKKNPIKETLLDKLVAQLKEKVDALTELEADHEEVFTAYRELVEERDSLADLLKGEARKIVSPGEQKVITDSANLMVSVVGKAPTISYDYDKALKAGWSNRAIDKCVTRVLDTKLVQSALEMGILSEEIAVQARVEKINTPAVTVRYNTGK